MNPFVNIFFGEFHKSTMFMEQNAAFFTAFHKNVSDVLPADTEERHRDLQFFPHIREQRSSETVKVLK